MASGLQHLVPRTEQDKFLRLPHKQRWEALKPIIVDLYTGKHGSNGKQITLSEVVAFMRTHYGFHAAGSEYPHHFRAWGVSKNIRTDEMVQVASVLGRRKRGEATSASISIIEGNREKPVDAKKLKRFLDKEKRSAAAQTPPLVLVPGLLSSFNLPYSAYVHTLPWRPDHPSPFGTLGLTPDTIVVRNPGYVIDTPSPNAQLSLEMSRRHRASLLLQGRRDDLLVSMDREDRRIMVDYFHDLFLHGYLMAKNWGREIPRGLTDPTTASLSSNLLSRGSPNAQDLLADSSLPSASQQHDGLRAPSLLCGWPDYTIRTSLEDEEEGEEDEEDEENEERSPYHSPKSLQESLKQSILGGDFSSMPSQDLPLEQEAVLKALEKGGPTMFIDVWKFAIMSGNHELIFDLHRRGGSWSDIAKVHPYHLAAAFLDGSRVDCVTFAQLLLMVPPFQFSIDDLGHSILDSFFVSILRSHTRINPGRVSHHYRVDGRFPGEEKDICGRWDLSSPAIRELHQQGHVRIPDSWKHPFCHTSIRAVCHNLISVFTRSRGAPDMDCSQLFIRQCRHCGTEYRLGPLHLLVVSAFFMGHLGINGETLLGALSVAICLMHFGLDPRLKTPVAVDEICNAEDSQACHHPELSATELMRVLAASTIETWPEDARIGWECLYETFAHRERSLDELVAALDASDESDSAAFQEKFHIPPCVASRGTNLLVIPCSQMPCVEPRIGQLWALIQAEFLTYRRTRTEDPWISDRFSMKSIIPWLRGETDELNMPLVTNNMLAPHSRCGWFHKAPEPMFPFPSDVLRSD